MYEHNATAGQPQVRTYEFPTITNNALEWYMVMQIQKIRMQHLLGQLLRNTVIQQNGCCMKFNSAVDLSTITNVAWNMKFAMFMDRINTHEFDMSVCQ
jgi:hypothetical protein